MRPTYATRLTMKPRPGDTGEGFPDRIVAVSESWVGAVAARHRLEVPETGPVRLATNDDRTNLIEILGLEDAGRWVWRATVRSPLASGHHVGVNLTEQVEIEIVGRDEEPVTVVTVRASVGSSTGVVVPVPIEAKTPRVVTHYVRDVAVRSGGETIEPGPWIVGHREVDALANRLLAADRTIPIIVVSPGPDGVGFVNAPLLSRTMLGLARVAVLGADDIARGLAERLPGPLAPGPGSIRLFWPCLTPGDDPSRHPVWTGEDLAAGGMARRFDRLTFRLVGDIAAAHIGPDREAEEIERAVACRGAGVRAAELEELQAAREVRDGVAAKLAAMASDLSTAREEAEENARLYSLAERERAGLRDESYQLQAKMRTVNAVSGSVDGSVADIGHGGGIEIPTTLAEAVRESEARYGGPHIVFHPNAIESAREGSYNSGMLRPFELLRGICEVARAYHDGTLKDSFEVAFESRGFSYRSKVSMTAKGLYKDDYRFLWDNGRFRQPIVVGPHLALGKGNPNNSLRMYWYVDTDGRRFVLCHVGKHLPDTTT
ncbi:MAG: hypothetical protein M3P94_02985 [Chloroflexota bacterium]|nr:hypothetical protein [Chloroflexota bacterium]